MSEPQRTGAIVVPRFLCKYHTATTPKKKKLMTTDMVFRRLTVLQSPY